MLQSQGKIPTDMDMATGQIHEFSNQKGKKYFVVCLENADNPCSLHVTRTGIYRSLVILRDWFNSLGQNCVAIARSKEICGLDFDEFLNLIDAVLLEERIRVVICSGYLKYVQPLDRDAVFQDLHSNPVGGHRGVNKTYNRIRN